MVKEKENGKTKDALFWKIRRQCVLKKDTCSKAALDLWKTPEGRGKLRSLMLANNMDFANVELELKRTSKTRFGRRKEGRWVTKHYLVNTMGWTRKMADNGFEYASRHNLLRTSQIHGEQEAKLLLDEAFSFDETHEQSTEQSQRMEIEDADGGFLADELPQGSGLQVLGHFDEDAEGNTPGDQAAANSGSFKLCFPSIQENASAVSVLPQHAKQIQIQVNYMQDIYQKLEDLQAECAVTRSARPETQQAILKLCAQCTKTDDLEGSFFEFWQAEQAQACDR
ncbi:unnamed protein product [Cladocopium goreaui]|uniref:Uncharacterized protein n=1 Tax=Cladocopium goreaui TaxID=2562237 RepID=A0A9P1BSX5_9DINO|nr:unnamed protein product [Cladocopium goreaui]